MLKRLRYNPHWVVQCDGKTVEECQNLGFTINDDWIDIRKKQDSEIKIHKKKR